MRFQSAQHCKLWSNAVPNYKLVACQPIRPQIFRAGIMNRLRLIVQQKIQLGVDGVLYYVRADVVAPEGEFALVGVLPVTDAEKQ